MPKLKFGIGAYLLVLIIKWIGLIFRVFYKWLPIILLTYLCLFILMVEFLYVTSKKSLNDQIWSVIFCFSGISNCRYHFIILSFFFWHCTIFFFFLNIPRFPVFKSQERNLGMISVHTSILKCFLLTWDVIFFYKFSLNL